MAPEQFHEMVSKESDQYALGCIAYELFTGHLPFSASNAASLITKCLMEQPVAPRQHNPQLPVHIEKAILQAMAKERTERYADIATFINALSTPSNSQAHIYTTAFGSTPKTEKQRMNNEENTPEYEEVGKASAEAYYNNGLEFEGMERYQEALQAYEKAIQLNPDATPIWCNKADILLKLNRYAEALKSYEYAIHLNPYYIPAYINSRNKLHNFVALVTFVSLYNFIYLFYFNKYLYIFIIFCYKNYTSQISC